MEKLTQTFRAMSVISLIVLMTSFGIANVQAQSGDYAIVDTGQTVFYDNSAVISPPEPGDPFYGQDAQYTGNTPSYTLSSDGLTVYDDNTGLTWQRTPDTNNDDVFSVADKLSWAEAQTYPQTLNEINYGGYSDWRLPTIKELYSLIDFNGIDPQPTAPDASGLTPFIDTEYFDFIYGDTSAGERVIDAQYWSSTQYVSLTMDGQSTVFGVNFADGRIKGYPSGNGLSGSLMTEFVRLVRGNTDYGQNDFVDNNDGTITDLATGLMWQQADAGNGYTWEEALAYAENLELAGYDDWRLPNAKELQSIVDYSLAPATNGSAAIDPLFSLTSFVNEAGQTDYSCYWTSTTHVSQMGGGKYAAYIAFGSAMGYMNGQWMDVHGAGSQRSDPKTGDPEDYPTGHGPQGDAIRIYNNVLVVRGGNVETVAEYPTNEPFPLYIGLTLLLIVTATAMLCLKKRVSSSVK
jgi:hypothetical protein